MHLEERMVYKIKKKVKKKSLRSKTQKKRKNRRGKVTLHQKRSTTPQW